MTPNVCWIMKSWRWHDSLLLCWFLLPSYYTQYSSLYKLKIKPSHDIISSCMPFILPVVCEVINSNICVLSSGIVVQHYTTSHTQHNTTPWAMCVMAPWYFRGWEKHFHVDERAPKDSSAETHDNNSIEGSAARWLFSSPEPPALPLHASTQLIWSWRTHNHATQGTWKAYFLVFSPYCSFLPPPVSIYTCICVILYWWTLCVTGDRRGSARRTASLHTRTETKSSSLSVNTEPGHERVCFFLVLRKVCFIVTLPCRL